MKAKMLKNGNYLVTDCVLVLNRTKGIVLRKFSHDGVSNDITTAKNNVFLVAVKQFR